MIVESTPNFAAIRARIHGCWLGKSIGGTLGLPAEGKTERQHFHYYDPVPTSAPPNDDLELQLVWLHLVEQAGSALTPGDFAQAWLNHIHYMWDEYGRCRWNLRRGVPPEASGTFENWFESGMGSPIRSEIWACLFPGDSESAGWYAALDASLDHGVEGIAGEVFFAVLQSLVLDGQGIPAAIDQALAAIPPSTEIARAIALVRGNWQENLEPWAAREALLAKHRHENFTHAPLNVALTVWALLHGGGEFEKTILLAVNAGYDTDCTAATAGAVLGLAFGPDAIPKRWSEPIGQGVYVGPGIRDVPAPATLTELTDRTVALQGKLVRHLLSEIRWSDAPSVNLRTLPGTITLNPLDGSEAVPWANGELPNEIKGAGGAAWVWEVRTARARRIVVLARHGARLLLNDQAVLVCPPGLPFVPAASRPPAGSVTSVELPPGRYRVRLELNSRDSQQEVSVSLAYPNRHLAPWSADELPHEAILPI